MNFLWKRWAKIPQDKQKALVYALTSVIAVPAFCLMAIVGIVIVLAFCWAIPFVAYRMKMKELKNKHEPDNAPILSPLGTGPSREQRQPLGRAVRPSWESN